MPSFDRAHQLAADFYIFTSKPRLADRTIVTVDDISGYGLVLAVDAETVYIADTHVPQLLSLSITTSSPQFTPGAILEPNTAAVREAAKHPERMVDAYEDIHAAYSYALAREAQRNGEVLSEQQAAVIAHVAAELRTPAIFTRTEPAPLSGPAPVVSHGGNEVGVELTALQVTQLLSQQISDPADVRAALHRLESKQGSIHVLDNRAELLYSEESKTYIAAMEPRDKQAFDANLTTLQATATPSADDIEADAMDEAAEAQERAL